MNAQYETPAVQGWDALTATRDRAIRSLRGTVLEIGAGRGENFANLASSVEWLGLEPSARFRRTLAQAARRHGHMTEPLAASAEAIPLDDDAADCVLATTVLCSVTNQGQVLDEINRILTPGGTALLAEHVAASPGTLTRRVQGFARPWTRLFDHGCDPTRDTEDAVRHSGLEIRTITRFAILVVGRLDMPFVVIEAAKSTGPKFV